MSAETAAQEIVSRVRSRLSSGQCRAVVAWMPDEAALTRAFAAARRDGDHLLGGVPFFVKDLFDVAGVPTFGGSTFLPEVRAAAPIDAAILRAARTAGLVCAGKTQLHEFAYGITGENPHYGDCDNPRFPGRTTGGSSSGSAAVVAADIVPVAFGTDTGGSIRVPAAFCGLYGLRLVPGGPWIRDAFPLSPSFDTAGWFTRDAADMRQVLSALIGVSSTRRKLRGCYLEPAGLDPDVALACRVAAESFAAPADEATGRELTREFAGTQAVYNTIVAAEAWEVHKGWAASQREHYDPAVWQRLNRAHSLTPADLAAAEAKRTAVQQLWMQFFQTYDFLVMPATPCPALRKAECTLENRNRLLALTAPASVGGLPVLTIPVRLPSGLSTGLQVIVSHPTSPVLPFVLARSEEQPPGVVEQHRR